MQKNFRFFLSKHNFTKVRFQPFLFVFTYISCVFPATSKEKFLKILWQFLIFLPMSSNILFLSIVKLLCYDKILKLKKNCCFTEVNFLSAVCKCNAIFQSEPVQTQDYNLFRKFNIKLWLAPTITFIIQRDFRINHDLSTLLCIKCTKMLNNLLPTIF